MIITSNLSAKLAPGTMEPTGVKPGIHGRKANAENIRRLLQQNRDSLEAVALSLKTDLLDAYSQIAKTTTVAIHAEEEASSAQKDLADCQRRLASAEETVQRLEEANATARDEAEQAWDYARRCREVLLYGTHTIDMLEGELREAEGELQLMKIREKEGTAAKSIDNVTTGGKCRGRFAECDNSSSRRTQQMEQRLMRLEEENRYLQDQLELYKRDARGKFTARHHVARVA